MPASSGPSRRPRRTRAEIDAAILVAVRRCLVEGGYSRLTFERVADYAEVSKHVIYRRHTTRAALALTGVSSFMFAAMDQDPGTGSLRSDLIELFRRRDESPVGDPSEVIRGILGEAGPEEMAHIERIARHGQEKMDANILAPARERGEIPDTPPLVRDAVGRLFRDTGLFPSESLKVSELIDEVILPILGYDKKED
ncbi:TetR/AcrR family transcriptional regulator [Corynebacterium vitaeruminis]|nr:TetR/AcrR family transcriptional regulator [Corynebacterium vitaeruminis]